MTNPHFSHIYLMGRSDIKGIEEALNQTFHFLDKNQFNVTTDPQTAHLMTRVHDTASTDEVPKDTDLIIVVGGDGSLLNAAHIAVQYDLPVLGINRGRLGFLTDILPSQIETLYPLLQGEYTEEKRFFTEAQFTDQAGQQHQLTALNDVVLLPSDIVHMIEYDTFVNEHLLYNQRADGLIIATPTGSTAYALSGGGPIVHPSLNAIVMVPMFPHTLSSRPIVLDGNSHIRVHINQATPSSPYLSCDGRKKIPLAIGSDIHVKKSQTCLRLIHPVNYDYFHVLREKLGWERRTRRA